MKQGSDLVPVMKDLAPKFKQCWMKYMSVKADKRLRQQAGFACAVTFVAIFAQVQPNFATVTII